MSTMRKDIYFYGNGCIIWQLLVRHEQKRKESSFFGIEIPGIFLVYAMRCTQGLNIWPTHFVLIINEIVGHTLFR
jgi:hypothetical protein